MTSILVIDDEPQIRDEIIETLELQGYTVWGATNGLEGIQIARETLPSLIICDVNMPELDGYETLKELRTDSRTSQIPFVFLTAAADYSKQRKAMRLGADDYLVKPFDSADLLDAVKTRIDKHRHSELLSARTAAQRAITVLEDERLRLASALESSMQQPLAALQLTLKSQNAVSTTTFDTVLNQLLDNTYQLILSLYPMMLKQLGLLPTLVWQVEQFQRHTAIPVKFEHSGLSHVNNQKIALGIYRILQHFFELIEGRAHHVTLQLWVEGQTLHGMAETKLNAPLNADSDYEAQIYDLQERLLSLGGQLSVVISDYLSMTWQLPTHPTHDTIKDLPVITPTEHQQSAAQTPAGSKNPQIGVVIADGTAIAREGLVNILNKSGRYQVVGETHDGFEVIDLVQDLRPQLLILDLMMPNINGLQIARDILQSKLPTHILMLSTQVEQAYLLEALRAGVTGYALKQSSYEELATAIDTVAQGKRYLSHLLSERALDAYLGEYLTENQTLDGYQTLTPREREVLELLAEGYKNAQIAEKLSISPRTSETHRANLMRKLGLQTQVDLVRYAIQRGIIPLQE